MHQDLRISFASSLLWIAAIIWGFAFVAQRAGMAHLGPFTFNGIRFLLGAFSLLPLILVNRHKNPSEFYFSSNLVRGGFLAGCVLFAAASLQQTGIVFTSAGKAGFITGLYLVIVPLIAVFLKQKITISHWSGAFVSLAGLYLLSVTDSLRMEPGDVLVLSGTIFWAIHILVIGWYAVRVPVLWLACLQFTICGFISLATGLSVEPISLNHVMNAAIPILYSSFFSIGIAYTLQVVAQKFVPAARASIILSMETVFAALGGWIILGETLTPRSIAGCSLMLAGILISQLHHPSILKRK